MKEDIATTVVEFSNDQSYLPTIQKKEEEEEEEEEEERKVDGFVKLEATRVLYCNQSNPTNRLKWVKGKVRKEEEDEQEQEQDSEACG
ncbi:unnamed protein product [Hydatigera taeniaeformis]|uniref:Ig-like domain-containing protein n=1 Tax=Hydatigena taeniaeformis TaxID=6205 RepID=A0A0R3XC26_HYDTA|nr:unnamed protein product [Hydatigera taeniaeformis]